MSIDFWKLDGTRFSTLPDLVSYNGYVKDINGDVYETKANSGVISKKQFTYNLTANTGWLSGTGNAISNIAIGTDGSLTATKVNLDDRYFTEQEIKNSYIPWDTRWNGTGGGFYKDGNVFINGNGYSDYLTNILTGIKNTINGLGSIYAKIGDCYTKTESDGRYALKTDLSKKQDNLGFTPIQQGGGYLQGTNKIMIGWSGSEVRCQVDNTDMGGIAFRSELAAVRSELANKQDKLGFTPVQQGGGALQGTNKIMIGFNASKSELRCQIGEYDKGAIAFKSDISNATVTIKQGGVNKGSFTLNGSGATIDLDIPDSLPVGSYIQFAGNQAPAGFLVCNGGVISRTTYNKLFAVIGTKYGSGDGSTTFNLPNLIDRFLQGSSTSGVVKNAGLPDITGSVTGTGAVEEGATYSGAFYYNGLYKGADGGDDWDEGFGFKASRSNSIYGNSSTVQPPALTCLICIKY